MKKILCSGLVLAFSIFWAPMTNTRAETIDFEGLDEGTLVNQVSGDGGSGPIGVAVSGTPLDQAIIFDSSCPPGNPSDCTGGDDDLGTPNFASGGPGRPGAPGAASNTLPLNNVLIIAEDLVDGDGDGLVDDPDDADIPNSMITFDFSALGLPGAGVTISSITYVDVDEGAGVTALVSGGVTNFPMPPTGDNGVNTINLGPTSGVETMVVTLNGSGGIDNIVFNFCGDGDVDQGEQCDDANNFDGDGCSAICETEGVCSLDLVKTATPVPPPGECKGGITELTLKYTGAVCGGGDNPQLDKKGNAKFMCSDDPVGSPPRDPERTWIS